MESLQNQLELGIISVVDATSEHDMIKSREFKIKKQLVDEVHITSNGKVRAIGTAKPNRSYPDGSVYTKFAGGKTVRAKDIASLYDKLYDIYFGDKKLQSATSVASIFESALQEKSLTENPKQGTLKRYRLDYNRFIDRDLAARDIASVRGRDLQEYTQKLVHSSKKPMAHKAFLAYKSVLNLIFQYAIEHELISKDPVKSIKNAVYLKDCDNSKPTPEERLFTEEEIKMLIDEVDRRMNYRRWGDYYVYGYAMKFSAKTGVRVGELCSLSWDDILWDERVIHIHSQQLTRTVDHTTEYYYAPYTKNERGMSYDGRYFPLTEELGRLLSELRSKQESMGIESEFVFCYKDGTWMKTLRYGEFLRKLCRRCGLKVTRNHGFRMSLNSNVLIQNGVAVTDRAALLGHSVDTNLKNYSYAQKDYVEKVRDVLDSAGRVTVSSEKVTFPDVKIIEFGTKKITQNA